MIGSGRKRLLVALLFLLPNIVGFLAFTAGPVVFSAAMSFTNWALTRHNRFSDEPIRFVGFQNYERLLMGDQARDFWDYFGNTLYLMVGIPLGIAGSLGVALLLSGKAVPVKPRTRGTGASVALIVTLIAAGGTWAATTPGPAPADGAAVAMSVEPGLSDLTAHEVQESRSNAAVLAITAAGVVVALGLGIGQTSLRMIFYLPTLLAGVAMFLLWKTLLKPEGGIINAGLEPVLDATFVAVRGTPAALWLVLGWGVVALGGVVAAAQIAVGAVRLGHRDVGWASFFGRCLLVGSLAAVVIGVGLAIAGLPGAAADVVAQTVPGRSPTFEPPAWLVDQQWAKAGIVMMGVWIGVGGANMLLFLAGLSNIPPELYEAADIDGASGWKRFINVTWPQLAPTTFFIVIMATIGGLQGGFEQARVMTGGQYDTTVLVYMIFNIAFTDEFNLALASAVAWVMFIIIFTLTLVNYRFGSQMTNE